MNIADAAHIGLFKGHGKGSSILVGLKLVVGVELFGQRVNKFKAQRIGLLFI